MRATRRCSLASPQLTSGMDVVVVVVEGLFVFRNVAWRQEPVAAGFGTVWALAAQCDPKVILLLLLTIWRLKALINNNNKSMRNAYLGINSLQGAFRTHVRSNLCAPGDAGLIIYRSVKGTPLHISGGRSWRDLHQFMLNVK